MKIAFSGSRDLEIGDMLIESILQDHPGDISILVGDCPSGVDKIVRRYARRKKIPIAVYEAAWSTYGKGAGPLRNRKMVQDCDYFVAIWDGKSKGTLSAIKAAIDYTKSFQVIVINDC